MTPRLLLLAAVPALAMPAAAAAQTAPVPTGTTAPPAATAPAPPPQKHARFGVVAERVGSNATVLTGRKIRVRGVVAPYVAGQKVTVRIEQSGKNVLTEERTVRKSATGSSGTFLVGYTPKAPGTLHIRASHLTTAALAAGASKTVSVDVLPTSVSAKGSGISVRILQQRLLALGYVPNTGGKFDARTARAVLAFRKYTGMARTTSANKAFFQKLASGAGAFKVRYPGQGRHIEGDLTHQVLALIGAGGKVERVYPISSGKPSTPTVLGTYRVYLRDFGTNSEGMVDSSYFHNGYAIHGYYQVPTYAASHGCLRAPIPDAASIYRWITMGTIVDVYYR